MPQLIKEKLRIGRHMDGEAVALSRAYMERGEEIGFIERKKDRGY